MKIATYGFAEDQGRKLGRILQLSQSTPYQLVEFDPAALPDLLLVFGEDQLTTTTISSLPSGYHSRLILVGKRRPKTQDYPFIGYPLVSSRVLNALDQLLCANEDFYEPETVTGPETVTEPELVTITEELVVAEEPLVVEAAPENLAEPAPASEQPAESEFEQPVEPGVVSVADDMPMAELAELAEVAEPVVPAEVVPQAESGERQYRVLVVDDSHPMQQALAKELQTQFSNIHIDFADEGLVALEQVEHNTYDFIFLDIMMPGIDGFETCTRMRQMEKLKKLPIIMLSSKTSPLDEVKGIMAGSSTYLTKPIDSAEFQKVMARIRKWVDNFTKDSNT